MSIRKLYNQREINSRVKELSKELYSVYKKEEVVFICTLKGAVFFACDLLKNYKGEARLEFLRVSSYKGKTSTGKIELNLSISKENIEGKNVVIIEDIVDTGRTIQRLKHMLSTREPKSVKVCTLLDKPSRRECDVKADYIGFEIDNVFVAGFGLDDDQHVRQLKYVGEVIF